MTHDSDLRHIYVTVPEGVARVHFLQFVENESHICDEDILGEPADRDTLRSSVIIRRPIGFGSNFMSMREYRYQRIWRVIGCRHDETVACQTLRENCVDCRHDPGAVFQKNKREGSTIFYR